MADPYMRTASMTQQSWGQIVVGPPGAGKTTYCQGMKDFMQAIERPAVVVNLDPANKDTPYVAAVTVTDLITVEEAMETLGLGAWRGVGCFRSTTAHLQYWPAVLGASVAGGGAGGACAPRAGAGVLVLVLAVPRALLLLVLL
jgi:hypothetical protein